MSSTRIVRHLRLHASDEAVVRHIALRLEDALRTATLPEAGGRLVLVRHLALGRIPREAAPQTLALGLERALAALAPACLPADHADADAAPAVYFRDTLDLHTQLALRLLAGAPADAWYWPLGVPGWQPRQPLPEALRRLAHSLAARPEAPTALPLWVAALHQAGHAGRLAAALTAADVLPLARAGGLAEAEFAPAAEPPARRPPSGAPFARQPEGEQRALSAAARRPTDARHRLLQALLARAGGRSGQVSPAAPSGDEQLRRAPGSPASPLPSPSARQAASCAGNPPPPRDGRPPDAASAAFPAGAPSPGAPSAGPPPLPVRGRALQVRRPSSARPAPSGAAAKAASGPSPWPFDTTATTAGGLLFLLPVLARLGYPAWLTAHPEWVRVDLPGRLFAEILSRLHTPPDDPAWSLSTRGVAGRVPRRFLAPANWQDEPDGGPPRLHCSGDLQVLWDASRRLPLGAWRGPCPRALLAARGQAQPAPFAAGSRGIVAVATHAWLGACRRWLRHQAGIGIATLVGRPAALALTPTHVDLFFALDQADLRLRRLGLDLDPGWLPWLGRVVNFHYRREGT